MPLDQTYDTGNGRVVKVGGIRVQDSHAGFNDMDFRTAVAQSSNVYFAKAIWERYADNKERYSDFMKKLHLDQTVGLEAFGEKKPLFQDWKEVPDPNSMLVRRSFGYRIKLSPIQVITLYNTIANDGKMISPILVRELRRGDDVVEHFKARTLVDKICSGTHAARGPQTSRKRRHGRYGCWIFRDTTLYTVAAKTGTAQYADDKIGYRDGYYIGSMVAYFPAHNPATRCSRRSTPNGRPANPITAARSRVRWSRRSSPTSTTGSTTGISRRKIQGKNTIPGESKAATSPKSAASPTNSRPAPRSKTAKAGERYGSTPLERHDLDARTGRPNDAQRRRHGTQRRPVPARKPGPQSFLLGTGSVNTKASLPARGSRAGSRNHNTQIKR